ncbi:hypothetical protein [Aeromonas sp. 6P]|uniref:hypothetical protein n=1 Tax=Aeromonas sp. 6P TaxID=3452722 RepID=UPI003F79D6A7
MTELERVLLDRLERIETAHQQQTAALALQLKQQARSLSELQTVCSNALKSCETLCSELQSSLDAAERGRALEQSHRDSAWQLEQQCQRLEQGAGRLIQGAELIVDRGKALRKEQSADQSCGSGLRM